MSIVAVCPCGAKFQAELHLAGEVVPCPTCGELFQIPMTSGPSPVRNRPAPQMPAQPQPTYSTPHSQPAPRPAPQQPAQQQPVQQQPALQRQAAAPAPKPVRTQTLQGSPKKSGGDSSMVLTLAMGIGGFVIVGALAFGVMLALGMISLPPAQSTAGMDPIDDDPNSNTDISSETATSIDSLGSETSGTLGGSTTSTDTQLAPTSSDSAIGSSTAASDSGTVTTFGGNADATSNTPTTTTPAPVKSGTAGGTLTRVTSDLEMDELVKRVEPSVVRFEVEGTKGDLDFKEIGSGFLISEDGLVMTNFHVVEDGRRATAIFADESTAKVSGFVAADISKDLCIVKLDVGELKVRPLLFAESEPNVGDKVVAFGSPYGFDFSTEEGIVSGIKTGEEVSDSLTQISGQDVYKILGYGLDTKWIQTTTLISSGNCGGPLVNMRGELVGVSSWKAPKSDKLNYATSVTETKALADAASSTIDDLAELPKRESTVVMGDEADSVLSNGKAEVTLRARSGAGFTAGKGDIARVFQAHKSMVTGLAISPDGKFLASTSVKGRTCVTNMKTGKLLYTIMSPSDPIRCVAFSNNLLFTFRSVSFVPAITTRDPASGEVRGAGIKEYKSSPPKALAVSPDGRTVVAVWGDGYVHVYRYDSLRETTTEIRMSDYGYRRHAWCATFTPRGRHVLIGDDTGELGTWTGFGSTLGVSNSTTAHRAGTSRVAVAPSGDFVATAGEDGSVGFWDKLTARRWRGTELKTGVTMSEPLALAITPNSRYVAVAFANSTIAFWDAETKKHFRTMDNHPQPVTGVVFTSDGKYMITASTDGALRMIELRDFVTERAVVTSPE